MGSSTLPLIEVWTLWYFFIYFIKLQLHLQVMYYLGGQMSYWAATVISPIIFSYSINWTNLLYFGFGGGFTLGDTVFKTYF